MKALRRRDHSRCVGAVKQPTCGNLPRKHIASQALGRVRVGVRVGVRDRDRVRDRVRDRDRVRVGVRVR